VFTTFAVLSLAVGLGITTAFYSVMSAVLWPTSGLERPDRLLVLGTKAQYLFRENPARAASRGEFEDFRAAQTSMTDIAAWTPFSGAFVDASAAAVGPAIAVTGNTFGLLGFRMSSGRAIQPADDTPSAPAVIVLAHAFWSKGFHGELVLGRILRVNGAPFEVIGVAARDVRTIGRLHFEEPKAWIPLTALRHFSGPPSPLLDVSNRNVKTLGVIGRLKDRVEIAAARAEAAAIGERLDRSDRRGIVAREWWLEPTNVAFAPDSLWIAWTMVVLVMLVPLVAATNLANLTLARGASRRHELAVRRALGATVWRLIREPLIESTAIALAGGAVGLMIASAILMSVGGGILPTMPSEVPTTLAPGVIVACLACAVLTLLVFGLWPALRAARPDVRAALIGTAGAGGTIRWRSRRGVIVGQVAVSAIFLSIGSVCVRGLVSSAGNDSGVDVDRLALAGFSFSANHWEDARGNEAAARLLAEARRAPGFEAVALTSGLPFGISPPQMAITTPDQPVDPDSRDSKNAYVISATRDIFRVLGVPLIDGRGFDDRDIAGAPPVAVISSLTATTLFGESNAVGRQLLLQPYRFNPGRITAGIFTIVGVARDTDTRTQGRRRDLVIYLPFEQRYAPSLQIVARATGDPTAAVSQLRTIVRRVEPDLAPGASGTGTYLLGGPALGLVIFGGAAATLGAIVVVLAMAGLFGVLSHLVATRTREFGVRQALGATRGDIIRLVLRDGVRPVLAGLIVGVVFGGLGRLAFTRMVPSSLSGFDWLAYALVPAPLIAAALLACYLPARRAASVDASVALRDE
jgi:predicted permease